MSKSQESVIFSMVLLLLLMRLSLSQLVVWELAIWKKQQSCRFKADGFNGGLQTDEGFFTKQDVARKFTIAFREACPLILENRFL